ncbi:MAG: putative lipid II flippase FtsW [Elusimicrobia bacterium]|nr:putative lipid II flippase FtsW [Elusimicrobiota bacterium]
MGRRVYYKSHKPRIDYILLSAIIMMIIIGLVMVFSSSAIYAAERYSNMYFFVVKQLLWTLLGSLALLAGLHIKTEDIGRMIKPAMFVTIILLVLVLIPFIGSKAGGARRWIRLGPVGLQPAELAKIIVVFYLAAILDRKFTKLEKLSAEIAPPLILITFVALLIYAQPDFGTAMIIMAMTGIMLFLGGIHLRYLGISFLVFLIFAVYAIFSFGYRRARIVSFLNPFDNRLDSGFQLAQSLTALGAGGLKGVGLGAGQHKLFFLPEMHTDFVFALIGQEMGFAGTMGVIILFLIFTARGFRIALRHPDYFSQMLAAGITLLISLQAAINIAIVTGCLPTKGLSLPFISFGGSSLFLNMFAVGVLLNLSRGVRKRIR